MTHDDLHRLIGDIRQLASDLLTYDHHGKTLPQVTKEQIQDLTAGQSTLNELYWQVFNAPDAEQTEAEHGKQ